MFSDQICMSFLENYDPIPHSARRSSTVYRKFKVNHWIEDRLRQTRLWTPLYADVASDVRDLCMPLLIQTNIKVDRLIQHPFTGEFCLMGVSRD